MTVSNRVNVNKDLLNWAIAESQLDMFDLLAKYPKVDEWMKGTEKPTFKQLEGFANFIKVPFGYMFLKTPPRNNAMQIEYRSINNKLPKMSKELKDSILDMDLRREWMRDYRKNLGWERIGILEDFSKTEINNVTDVANLAKSLLGVQNDWFETVNDYDEAFKFLREKMESVGILVMQNGIVGMNTHRPLDLDEFRAFMLYDEVAPIIFINSKDSKAGKIFSIIHEYIHFLYQKEDILLNQDREKNIENEKLINSITAEFLMPTAYLREIWDYNQNSIKQIVKISKMLKVSRYALGIKLKEIELINEKILNDVILLTQEDLKNTRNSEGGNFYKTYFTRNSPTFTRAVISGAETQEISYTYAFKLLGGIKGKTYDRIKEAIIYNG